MVEAQIRTRAARSSDLEAVLELEALCFDDPWSDEAIAAELRADRRHCSLVLEVDGSLRGVALIWHVADELHLLSLAVHPDFRRRGLASRLLESMRALGHARGAALITLEVRERNAPAIAFYHRHGFVDIALRARYYPDTHEDALVMLLPLEGPRGGAPPAPS